MSVSYKRIIFLIRISCSKFKNPISIQELIKIIGISRANFTNIKKILTDNEIITEHDTFGNAKLLDINIEKLDRFIKKSEFYNLLATYIRYKDPLLYQP